MAGILLEEPPINGTELYEIISDFIESFKITKSEAVRKCNELYADL